MAICLLLMACAVIAGCQTPPAAKKMDAPNGIEEHSRLFGNFQLPIKVGMVENRGPQLPVVSPDGKQILYLRVDADALSPMTLFGSADPADTSKDGTLAIWIRPLEGTSAGHRLSRQRWSHSPVWSTSGKSVAYVSNEAEGTVIVHLDMTTGRESLLGVPKSINVMPRFDGDDEAVLFCTGAVTSGPFRVFRQRVGGGEPTPLTPDGQDCVLPVLTDETGRVVCAAANQNQLRWVLATSEGMTDLSGPIGEAERPALAAICAGIAEPASFDRHGFAFYNAVENRVTACDLAARRLALHRTGSIAACWFDHQRFALATQDNLFAVNAFNGVSVPLMSGAWIPARFVPDTQTLIVLGKGPAPSRLAIYSIVFEPAPSTGSSAQEKH